MDPERLLRLSIAGWVLLASFVVHFWVFGGDLKILFGWIPTQQSMQAAATVLAAVAAGPALGFFISGWVGLWRSIYYLLPATKDEAPQILNAIERLLALYAVGFKFQVLKSRYTTLCDAQLKNLRRELEPTLTFLFHGNARDSVVQYCTRRWTLVWMWLNSAAALLAGAVLALPTRVILDIARGVSPERHLDWKPLPVEAFLVICGVPAYFHIRHLRTEVEKMLRHWLLSTSQFPSDGQIETLLKSFSEQQRLLTRSNRD